MEIETQFEIAQRLGYITPKEALDVCQRTDEIGRMLTGLLGSLSPKVTRT